MNGEPRVTRNGAQGAQFVHGIERPALGRLRQRQNARGRAMGRAPGKPGQRRRHALRRQFSAEAGNRQQLGAAGEKLRPAAFVHLDMAFLVTRDHAVGRRQHRQGEPVRRAPGRDEKNRAFALENLRKPRRDPFREIVAAIGRGGAVIGARDRLDDLRGRARPVVRCKGHGRLFAQTGRGGQEALAFVTISAHE